jgi:hypothetical protein
LNLVRGAKAALFGEARVRVVRVWLSRRLAVRARRRSLGGPFFRRISLVNGALRRAGSAGFAIDKADPAEFLQPRDRRQDASRRKVAEEPVAPSDVHWALQRSRKREKGLAD